MRYRAIVGLCVWLGACGGGGDGAGVGSDPTRVMPTAGAGAQQAADEQARRAREQKPPTMRCMDPIVDANGAVVAAFGVDILNDGDSLAIRCWTEDADGNVKDDSKVLDRWTADDVACKDVDGWHFELGETWATASKDGVKHELRCDTVG